MFVRHSALGLLAGLTLLSGLTGASTSAPAQEYRNWDRGYQYGYGPWRPRPHVQTYEPYDDRDSDESYNEPEEPRYQRRYEPQAVPRPAPRRNGWNDRDDQDSRDRQNADQRFRNHRFNPPGRYDSQDAERDDYRRRDTAREPQPQEQQAKVIGSDGGPRPEIQPLVPPRVAFSGGYTPGSIVIDTSGRKLYYVTGLTSALAYPIGVGREGFAWTGAEKISRVSDWPDWYPPAEMRKRKPELPERMMGGVRNPLGVKALYLGNTLYRIHGTNDPKSIGKAESSGCFRMLNAHVLHLASLAGVGTQVTIVNALHVPKIATRPSPNPTPSVSARVNDNRRRFSEERPRVRRWRDHDWDYYQREYR